MNRLQRRRVFSNNIFLLNPKKDTYMCLAKNSDNCKFEFEKLCVEISNEEIILSIAKKNKLTLDSFVKNISKKDGQKLWALSEASGAYLESS